MCCTKNIENLNQVVKSLCRRYDTDVLFEEVAFDKSELDSLVAEGNERTLYYGILTTGVDTTVRLNLLSDGAPMVMDIQANSQIIELFEELASIDGDNIFFRGYSLTLGSR